MKQVRLVVVVVLLVLMPILTACTGSDEAKATFKNETECGSATITLTNDETGNDSTHTVEEGKKIEIKVDSGISYRYKVEYEKQPDTDIKCESKSGTILIPQEGQSANFTLESVTPTPTP